MTNTLAAYCRILSLAILSTLLSELVLAGTAEKILPVSAKEIVLRAAPFLSPVLMRGWWEPLREHIHAQAGMSVRISTSPNFVEILSDSADSRYNLYLVPLHFVPLLISKYSANAMTAINLKGYPELIYHKDLDIKNIEELRNGCIAMPHEIMWSSIYAKKWLAEKGLSAFMDYQPVHLTTFQEVVMKVFSGQCDLGVVNSVLPKNLPITIKNTFKTLDIYQQEEISGGMGILARKNFDSNLTRSIQDALLSFGKTESSAHHLSSPLYAVPTILDQKNLEDLVQKYQAIQPLLSGYLPIE